MEPSVMKEKILRNEKKIEELLLAIFGKDGIKDVIAGIKTAVGKINTHIGWIKWLVALQTTLVLGAAVKLIFFVPKG